MSRSHWLLGLLLIASVSFAATHAGRSAALAQPPAGQSFPAGQVQSASAQRALVL